MHDDLDQQPSFDDVVKLVTVDRHRKKKVHIVLVDEDGDEVDVKSLSKQLVSYITDQFKLKEDLEESDEDPENVKPNYMINKIMPLVSQSLVSALPELLGEEQAYMTLTMGNMRHSSVVMMMLAVSLFKFIQDKNLKIRTEEEDISDEEIEKMVKISKATQSAAAGAMMGLSPQEVIQQMYENGEISEEDLHELIGKDQHGFDVDDDDDNEY